MNLPLSVLDLMPIPSGSTPAQAVENTLDLARHADAQGFTRYWLAEHHNMSSLASSAPELMVGVVARATTRIRVGSGGVMLPNHAPLKVAENFRTLEALAPGRIDLGIGRAPGTDGLTAMALRRSAEGTDDLPGQLAQVEAFAGVGAFPDGHPFGRVTAAPDEVPLPPIWLLGSSDYSARLAAAQGRGFAFAYHFSADAAPVAMSAYREGFRPSATLGAPHAILTVSVVCAETDAEAEKLAVSQDLAFLNLRLGRRARYPSVEEARAYPYSEAERVALASYRATQVIGSPARVRARLTALARQFAADEVMVSTMVHDHAARVRSYALVAEAFGLGG
ncbi:LLM class flavin-dependent oxidoreductase [Deinococcus maricopensis]|uniref:Luciferase family oxidoreductase, group 1 n=1 Tax=Deinococcus maricopensis (strain DSM 21211 / LMG 22137 / NRRL B-23946 / LB-34) TaxID=709986 RepID=E8UAP1_DEIML|nr:LLM class flavin-dependent oxidoreductase [Deinococcus maricopensis]ADV68130.1 luciferase family oxidoreductase, group 1 [Deinococcus maricopensis DSM 21211]